MKKVISFLVFTILSTILVFSDSFSYADQPSGELFEFLGIPWDSFYEDRDRILQEAGLELDGNNIIHAQMKMFGLDVDEVQIYHDKITVNFDGISESWSDNKFATFNDAVALCQHAMDGFIDSFGHPSQVVLYRIDVERKAVDTTDVSELFTPENFFGVDSVCVTAKLNNIKLDLLITFGTYGVDNSIQLFYYNEPVSLDIDEIIFSDEHTPAPTAYIVDLDQ